MAGVSHRLWGTSLNSWVKRARPLTPDNLRPLPYGSIPQPTELSPCFFGNRLFTRGYSAGLPFTPPTFAPQGPLHSGVCCRVGASSQHWSVSPSRDASPPGALPYHPLKRLLPSHMRIGDLSSLLTRFSTARTLGPSDWPGIAPGGIWNVVAWE